MPLKQVETGEGEGEGHILCIPFAYPFAMHVQCMCNACAYRRSWQRPILIVSPPARLGGLAFFFPVPFGFGKFIF